MKLNIKIFFSLIALILGIFLYTRLIDSTSERNNNRSQSEQPSITSQKQSILSTSKISVPEIVSQTEVDISDEPLETTNLIPASASESKIVKLRYSNGAKGLKINYEVPNPVDEIYHGLRKNFVSNNWKLINGSRASSFALLEMEKEQVQIKIYFEEQNSGTLIEIYTIESSQ